MATGQNLEFEHERAVAGHLTMGGDNQSRAVAYIQSEGITPDHFRHPTTRAIYTAAVALAAANNPVSISTIGPRLMAQGGIEDAGGAAAITFPGCIAANLPYHCAQLREDYARERFKAGMRMVAKNLGDPDYDYLAETARVTESCQKARRLTEKASKEQILSDIRDEAENGVQGKLNCLTGISVLDEKLEGGLLPGELVTVAGPTGGGKSVLLMQFAWHYVLNGNKSSLIVSSEMPPKQVYRRLIAHVGGVYLNWLKNGVPEHVDKEHKLDLIARATEAVQNAKIDVIEETDFQTALSEIRLACAGGEVGLVALDYIQRFEGDGDNRELAVAGMARSLKSIALDQDIVVVTASQLNDDGNLRESRAIGHESDIVIKIDPGDVDDELKLNIQKYRDGARGAAVAKADFGRMRITDAGE